MLFRIIFQLVGSNTALNLQRAELIQTINDAINSYAECQEMEYAFLSDGTKEILSSLEECLKKRDFVEYSYNVF